MMQSTGLSPLVCKILVCAFVARCGSRCKAQDYRPWLAGFWCVPLWPAAGVGVASVPSWRVLLRGTSFDYAKHRTIARGLQDLCVCLCGPQCL